MIIYNIYIYTYTNINLIRSDDFHPRYLFYIISYFTFSVCMKNEDPRSKIDHTLKLPIYLYCLLFYLSSYLKSLSFQKNSKFLLNMFKLSASTTLSGNSFQLFMTLCEKLNCL